MIKRTLWNLLLMCAPDEYEKRKATRLGLSYPNYFDNTKSIFIHVPKAAGTSVGMALYGRQIPHTNWRQWRELNPKKFATYFKFAVVRDPLVRFSSAFYYLKDGGMNAYDAEYGGRLVKDFATPNDLAKRLIDYQLQKQLLDWWHFCPQSDYVANEHGSPQTDLLIRCENLQAGIARVARELKIDVPILPHLNRTVPYEVNFDDESRAVLACIYRNDFVLWEKHAV